MTISNFGPMSQLQPKDYQPDDNIPAQVSTGFVSLQHAYNLLQRGMERYQRTGELFSEDELATLGYFQEKMVLGEEEARLISESRIGLDQHEKQQKLLIASALLFTLTLLLTPGWLWLFSGQSSETGTSNQASIIKEPAIQKEVAKLPVGAKVNVGPGEKPVKKETSKPGQGMLTPEMASALLPPLVNLEKEDKPEEKTIAADPAKEKKEIQATAQKFERQVKVGKIYLVSREGKWGMIDSQGRFLLPIRYDAIRPFSQDGELLQIKNGEKRGIATSEGVILLHPYFDKFTDYNAEEGLIMVMNQGKHAVYSRQASNFILDFKYNQICCYSEGMFGVQLGTADKWSFVGRDGKKAFNGAFDAIEQPFIDNKAVVRLGTEKFFIDKTGRKLASLP